MTDLSLCPVPAFPVHANVKDASSEGVLQFLKSSPYVSAGVVFYSFPSPTPNGSRRHLQSHYLASSRFPCFPSRVNLVSLKWSTHSCSTLTLWFRPFVPFPFLPIGTRLFVFAGPRDRLVEHPIYSIIKKEYPPIWFEPYPAYRATKLETLYLILRNRSHTRAKEGDSPVDVDWPFFFV